MTRETWVCCSSSKNLTAPCIERHRPKPLAPSSTVSVRALASPVIMAVVFLSGAVVATVNLMVDLAYGLLDPRVSYR
jgi:hypothetical protein